MVNRDAISNLMNTINTIQKFAQTFPSQVENLKDNKEVTDATSKLVDPEFMAKINEARNKIYSI